MAVVRLPDPKLKTLGKRGIECIFVGYAEHSKAFRFYVIEPNELVPINSIINSRDDMFDENRFSPVPRPSQRSLIDRTEDIGGSVLSDEVTKEMDVKTTFLNGELDEEVDLTKEFLSSKFTMKDMGEADIILDIKIKHESNGMAISQSRYIEKVLKKFNYFDCTPMSTLMDTSEKSMPNNGQAVSQLEYSRVIGSLLLYKISNTKDNSSTISWVFLLGGGAISWASKKQTCITSSTIEFEFVVLETAGKEAEWLRNMILGIPLWSKPIAPLSICCDSTATLAKAYSQIYTMGSLDT
ncbi:zinc finger, CCHC-type containing protein [Tanacetum coccineum]